MTDPDMGDWSYAYDNLGNLLRQTDNRGQSTCFRYDALSRVIGKQYTSGASCPPEWQPDVAYSYDSTAGGSYGIGHRTAMTDTTGSSAWTYDARGRMISETKVVSGAGGGTFATQWAYDAADRLTSQTYPGGAAGQAGEQVTTGYGLWGQPDTLTGASNYVTGLSVTADGRPDLLNLGGTAQSPLLQIDWVYYPWTTPAGRGRLQQLTAGTPGDPTSLQELSYTYDRAGNVRSITDGHVVTPTVEFLYDSLSRLVIARGGYFGHYAYDAIGNITARDGSVYTYTNEQPHAVRQVIGSGAPITRTVTLMARAEGGDTTVTLEVNGSTRGAWNVISATQYATYTLEVALTGHDVFELWFDDGGGTRTLYVDRVEVQRVDLPPLTDPLSHRLYMAAILRNTEGEGDGGLGLGLGAPSFMSRVRAGPSPSSRPRAGPCSTATATPKRPSNRATSRRARKS